MTRARKFLADSLGCRPRKANTSRLRSAGRSQISEPLTDRSRHSCILSFDQFEAARRRDRAHREEASFPIDRSGTTHRRLLRSEAGADSVSLGPSRQPAPALSGLIRFPSAVAQLASVTQVARMYVDVSSSVQRQTLYYELLDNMRSVVVEALRWPNS